MCFYLLRIYLQLHFLSLSLSVQGTKAYQRPMPETPPFDLLLFINMNSYINLLMLMFLITLSLSLPVEHDEEDENDLFSIKISNTPIYTNFIMIDTKVDDYNIKMQLISALIRFGSKKHLMILQLKNLINT